MREDVYLCVRKRMSGSVCVCVLIVYVYLISLSVYIYVCIYMYVCVVLCCVHVRIGERHHHHDRKMIIRHTNASSSSSSSSQQQSSSSSSASSQQSSSISSLREAEVSAACLDDNGKRLVTAADNGKIRMWNFTYGYPLYEFASVSGGNVISKLVYLTHSQERLVGIGNENKILRWSDPANAPTNSSNNNTNIRALSQSQSSSSQQQQQQQSQQSINDVVSSLQRTLRARRLRNANTNTINNNNNNSNNISMTNERCLTALCACGEVIVTGDTQGTLQSWMVASSQARNKIELASMRWYKLRRFRKARLAFQRAQSSGLFTQQQLQAQMQHLIALNHSLTYNTLPPPPLPQSITTANNNNNTNTQIENDNTQSSSQTKHTSSASAAAAAADLSYATKVEMKPPTISSVCEMMMHDA